jgi:hypothetical protein
LVEGRLSVAVAARSDPDHVIVDDLHQLRDGSTLVSSLELPGEELVGLGIAVELVLAQSTLVPKALSHELGSAVRRMCCEC